MPMRVYEAKLVYKLVSDGLPAVLDQPELIPAYLESAIEEHPLVEGFYVIMLNRRNRALGYHMVSLGTVGSTLVHPREVFKPAILASASAVIVSHNHPSGDPSPSAADVRVTRTLREAAQVLDISLLDHVIVGQPDTDPTGLGFYSFRNAGML